MQLYKRYIEVILKQKKDGEIVPLYVVWDDGKKYKIEKIFNKQRRASTVGGCGLRYSCMIEGKQRNIFYEKDKWFIESHRP